MGTLVALLAILGYGLYLSQLVKRPLESSLLFVCSSLIILLYISALLGCLQITAQLLLGIGVVLFFACIFARWNSGTIVQTISPGILFFLLSTVGFWLLTCSEYYSHFVLIDDFSHWGRMAKIIANSNRLIIPSDAIFLKDYPPGVALFDYLFLQFGGFSESRAMFSQGILVFSAFAQLFSVIPKTMNRYAFFGVNVFMYALINSLIWFFGTGLHTLSVDLVVGVVFGIALFGYLVDRKNGRLASVIHIVPLVMVLPLIKLIGILFSCAIVSIVVCDILLGSISGREKLKLNFAALLLMAFCIITYVSWGEHVKNTGLTTTFSSEQISPDNVMKAFSPASATESQKITIANFIHRVFPLHREPHLWLVLCLVLLWIIWRTGMDYNPLERTIPFALLVVGFYAYLFVLLLLYLFSFNSYEGPRLASFSRYENTYLVGMFIVFFGVSLSQFFKIKQDKTIAYSLIAISFLAMLPYSARGGLDVSDAISGGGEYSEVENIIQYSKVIVKMTSPNSRVYFIWQGGSNDESVEFNYGILPRTNNTTCSSVGELYPNPDGGDVWTCQLSPSEFNHKLMDYDYLLIAHADKKFEDRFLPLFGLDHVQDGSLFQILKETGHVKLNRISLESGHNQP